MQEAHLGTNKSFWVALFCYDQPILKEIVGHIRIFVQVNWLVVTLLLISLRKASIRGRGGERNLPLSQEYSLSSHKFMGGQKTQKHYHKTQFEVSSMCSQPIHQTCQQTTSMGVAESSKQQQLECSKIR